MSLVDKILGVDRRLQSGAANISHKANELVGLGNYELSSIAFGASAAASAFFLFREIYDFNWMAPELVRIFTHSLYLTISGHKVWHNSKLKEKEEAKSGSDAASIDYKLQLEKQSFVDVPVPLFREASGRFVFGFWLVFDVTTLDVTSLPADFAMLMGQYFREVNYIGPTKKNKVHEFIANLVPKLQKPSYNAPPA